MGKSSSSSHPLLILDCPQVCSTVGFFVKCFIKFTSFFLLFLFLSIRFVPARGCLKKIHLLKRSLMKPIEISEIGSKTVLMKRRVAQGLGLPIMWGSENFRIL